MKSIIDIISNSPTLQTLWKNANYVKIKLSVEQKYSRKGLTLNGQVIDELLANSNNEYISHKAFNIELYKAAFSTFSQLAYTIGHEFVHVKHINSGFTLKVYNKMDIGEGKKYLERLAYTWEINFGNSKALDKLRYYE